MSLCRRRVCARLNTRISDYTCTQLVNDFGRARGGLGIFSLLPCLRLINLLVGESDAINLVCVIRSTEQSINQSINQLINHFINQSVSLSVNVYFPSYLETDSNNKVFCDVRVFKAEATFRQLRRQNLML